MKKIIIDAPKTIKKHNSLTDGYIPKTGKAVLPDKLLNALYWKYEQEGEKFKISMAELRGLLSLKSIKDDARIIEALKALRTTVTIRDFSYKGREVEMIIGSFLTSATIWKDNQKYIEIKLDDMIIEALKQKAGYTPLELDTCNQFRTKYGLKLYEMFIRYYRLPNRQGSGVGTVSKTLDELNQIFDTHFKHASQMLRSIDRGLKEIKKIAGEDVFVYYNKPLKSFVFSWEQKEKYPKLRIPYGRIDELIDWYLGHHQELKIKNLTKYRADLKNKILNDDFEGLDALWGGMLKYRYGIEPERDKKGKFKDFNVKPSNGLL